jgi:hypothetical protein
MRACPGARVGARQSSAAQSSHAAAASSHRRHHSRLTASPARLSPRASASQHSGDAVERSPLRVLLTGASSGALEPPYCILSLLLVLTPRRAHTPGLGAAVLTALAHASGNTAVATCLSREPALHAARLGDAPPLAVDLADSSSVSVLARHLAEQQRPYDVVIHAAGGAPDTGCACAEAAMTRHLLASLAGAPPSTLLVYVSALGVGSTADCLPGQSVDVLLPWLSQKESSEEAIRSSGHSQVVILRPGPLTSTTATSLSAASCILARPDDAASAKVYSPISRQALGQLIASLAVGHHSRGGTPPAGWDAATVWAVLDPQGVVIASPYMRRLEAWESLPFEAVHLPASRA